MKSGSTTPSPRGSRLRMKRKRLDAICESVYNQNHTESNPNGDNYDDGNDDDANAGLGRGENLELRRSSRVRRAPVLLDVSPPPVKKRKKKGKGVEMSRGFMGRKGKIKEEEEEESEEEEDLDVGVLGGWRSRLRSRGRGLKGRKRGETSVRGKEEVEDEDEGNMLVMSSKRLGRVKALNGLGNEGGNREESQSGSGKREGGEEEEGESGCGKRESGEEDEMDVARDESEGDMVFVFERDCGNEEDDTVLVGEVHGSNKVDEPVVVGEPGSENAEDESMFFGERGGEDGEEVGLGVGVESRNERLVRLELDKNGNKENLDEKDGQVKELANGINGEDVRNGVQADGIVNEVKDGVLHEEEEVLVDKISVACEKDSKLDEMKKRTADAIRRPSIKQGRRCGLCGCGNDGKPPKRLVQGAGDSDNEAYSGSSASEDPNYDMWDGFGDEPEWLGRLLGPINDRFGIAGVWVHQHCAVWSPEVYFAGLGHLKSVRAALCRGRALKCTRCGRPGATIGCRVDRCPKTYHLPCARANGCIFDHRKFLIACTDHRHLFQPHGQQFLMRLKKLKAKKMKLEIRKQSNDAWRKDVEAEEKWLENCGEDEEFLKRESKRLHRDLLRIAPVYIGGSDSDSGKLFEGWESVAGLQDVILCMKEVVILPLLYPEFFSNLGITPPRGVLLHGYPGTGKTLVVRALIGSCARGDKRIAYFARKGADCLGKYVGDAERQLRLLFQVAERCQPSIIFFDEIDGLAPCRTKQQDQTHSSVVSTLLALMDGLKSRGSVIVIGATNRPEAIDPALRRPGRFDREIYFPLPSVDDRAAILSLHTQRWPRPVSGSVLHWVARKTVGFAGADLQSLCTQAAIIALKRNFPLQEVLSAAGEKAFQGKLPPLPAFTVEERDWLEALACAPPPCSRRVDGIAVYDLVSNALPTHLIPCLLRPLATLLVSLYLDERLWLPIPISIAAKMVKNVVLSSLKRKNLPCDNWWSHVDNLLKEGDVAKEIWRRLSHTGMLIGEATSALTDSLTNEAKDDLFNLGPVKMHCGGMPTSLFGSTSLASGKKAGFRVLIAGNRRSGQRHLASCILQCFVGNIEIHKVDLGTFSHEGHGDMVQGITRILLKCASLQSCMIFMPRVDLWAVEEFCQAAEETDDLTEKESCFSNGDVVEGGNQPDMDSCKASETAEDQAATLITSHSWGFFTEQLESICVSTSLMVLATSELPFQELPIGIRQFFSCDIFNSSNPIPLQHTVPRFPVDMDGVFSYEAVIRLAAAELSSDLIQSFIQLVHQTTHTCTHSYQENIISDSAKGCFEVEHCVQDEDTVQLTHDSSVGVPPPSNNRSLRGKPTLLLAITAFGDQILRYPHFAELCWVTSKLKDGPCANISGPWKGWPFNSCIIRPNNPFDKVAVTYASGAVKNKERSGVVRGLMAVGLLAYRCEYKSLREVSFEVRKVLELLVGQINERIQSGKDRYQYVRLLSQVAYLEDMVNNWAYTLQSLEFEASNKAAESKLNTMEIPGLSCMDSLQGEEVKGNASNMSYPECKLLEMSPRKLAAGNLEGETRKEDILCYTDGAAVLPDDRAAQKVVPCDDTILDDHEQTVAADDLFGEQNELTLGCHDPENTGNVAVPNGNCEFSKHSTGFVSTESVVSPDDGLCNSGELLNLESSGRNSYKIEELNKVGSGMTSDRERPVSGEHVEEMNCSPTRASGSSAESGVACSYQCCSRCLHVLHDILGKVLISKLGLCDGNWSVEDVHDVVKSLSVELLSAIRKVGTAKSGHVPEDMIQGNLERCGCHCEGPGNGSLSPMECGCHSVEGCVTAETNNSEDFHFGSGMKFVFRDGVLVPVNSNEDFAFHCTYETLCLCSLTKSILMVKQLSD